MKRAWFTFQGRAHENLAPDVVFFLFTPYQKKKKGLAGETMHEAGHETVRLLTLFVVGEFTIAFSWAGLHQKHNRHYSPRNTIGVVA